MAKYAETIAKVGVKKETGYLYFLNKAGDVARAKMRHGRSTDPKEGAQVLARVGVKREAGYLYFITKDGNVARTKMARGRKSPSAA